MPAFGCTNMSSSVKAKDSPPEASKVDHYIIGVRSHNISMIS